MLLPMSRKSEKKTEIFAAGGLLWREGEKGRELALVYRKRYGDWSLPKGKSDKGESLEETALREVEEETGCQVRMGGFLKCVIYEVKGRQKEVHYWEMEFVSEGGPLDEDEVAELVWLKPQEALERMTYETEKEILRVRSSLSGQGG